MPEASTAAEARPDLSALPREMRLRIAVMETQGATWGEYDGLLSHILWAEPIKRNLCPLQLCVRWRHNEHFDWRGPDPLTDPAAWGALLEKEKICVDWLFDHEDQATGAAAWPALGGAPDFPQQFAPTAGEAVCLAVLTKCGVPVPE